MKKEKKQNRSKKTNRISLKNGITFQPAIDMTVKTPVLSFFPLIQLALAVISSLSVIYMLPAFLNSANGNFTGSFEVTNGTTVFMVVAFTSIAALFCMSKEVFAKLIGIGYLCLNSIYIFMHIKSAVNGFMYTANVYSKCASFATPLFAQTSANTLAGDTELFLVAFAFIITLLTAFGCIFHISFPIEFLTSFPIFELMTFWGMRFNEDYIWTIVGMLFSWVMILSLSLINHTAKNRNSDSTFAVHNKKKTYYLTSKRLKHSFFGLMTYAIAIISVTVFIVTISYIHRHDDIRTKKLDKMRYDISTGVRDLSRNVTEQASLMNDPIPGRGTKMVGGTNGGRLGLYDELKFYGKTAMRVTVPKFYRPLYLRGYAGEKYENNTWAPIKADSDTAEVFEAHYGGFLLDYDFIHTFYSTMPGAERIEIKIDPLNCSEDVIYAPYGAYYSQIDEADEQKYDGIVSPLKKKQGEDYTITMLSLADESLEWQDIIAKKQLYKAPGTEQDALKEYDRNVIHSEDGIYTYVPEEAIPSIDRVITGAGLELQPDEPYSINYIEKSVKEYLYANGYTYDLKPGVTPTDKDFVSYFLDEQKKGYCTYFASAGVMIMRRMGIPARFVEGYLIEPSQYNDNGNPIVVSDRCAHAWCEVFIDGCGWYPVEFTPGYTDDNPNLTDADRNNVRRPNNKNTVSKPENTSKDDNSSSKADISNSESSSSSAASDADSSEGSSNADGVGTVSGSSSSKKPSDRTPEDAGLPHEINFKKYAYTLLTIGFIAFVTMTAVVRRENKLERIYKKCNCTDNKKSVINCYVHALQYAKLLGLENNDHISDVQLTSRMIDLIEEKMPDLKIPFIKLSEAAILAYMGDMDISDETSSKSRNTYNDIRNRVFELMNPLQKLRAMWGLGLY